MGPGDAVSKRYIVLVVRARLSTAQARQSEQILLELRIPERHRSAEVELKSIGYRVKSFHGRRLVLATAACDCNADTEAND